MRFIAIIYGSESLWESFSNDQIAEAIGNVNAFETRYCESGELLAAYGLADESTAKTVSVRDGASTVTNGRHVDSEQFVSSFFVLDCESEQRALDIVAEHPFASQDAVETWPVLHEI